MFVTCKTRRDCLKQLNWTTELIAKQNVISLYCNKNLSCKQEFNNYEALHFTLTIIGKYVVFLIPRLYGYAYYSTITTEANFNPVSYSKIFWKKYHSRTNAPSNFVHFWYPSVLRRKWVSKPSIYFPSLKNNQSNFVIFSSTWTIIDGNDRSQKYSNRIVMKHCLSESLIVNERHLVILEISNKL